MDKLASSVDVISISNLELSMTHSLTHSLTGVDAIASKKGGSSEPGPVHLSVTLLSWKWECHQNLSLKEEIFRKQPDGKLRR